MYRDRERDDTQLSAHASEITADDHQEPSTTRFSSSGPLPQVDHAAGPVGPMGSTASDRAYDLMRRGWAKENHLLGSSDLRRLFPGPVRIVNLGLTLVAIT